MRIETSTEVKNHFGEILDAALREPVLIQRSGRNTVVMLAYEDYEELLALADKEWGKKAKAAKAKGFAGAAASDDLLGRLLNARD